MKELVVQLIFSITSAILSVVGVTNASSSNMLAAVSSHENTSCLRILNLFQRDPELSGFDCDHVRSL